MDALQEQAMSKERVRRRESELRLIENALRRIEHDEFGECAECGELIARARLEFNPSAELCLVCATAFEQSKL